jgi:hypothetical protein
MFLRRDRGGLWARRSASAAGVLGLAGAGLAQPIVTAVERVTGTPATLSPDAFIANLDAGSFVAGFTRWDNDGDGVFFAESFVGFLWTPADGMRVFELAERDFVEPQFHFLAEIADNGSVVGTQAFRQTFESLPFIWSPRPGFRLMPIPRDWNGSASGVSADGSVAVGEMHEGLGAGAPTQAVYWSIGKSNSRPRRSGLPSGELWSNAHDVSADGAMIVGDSGPDRATVQAVRWDTRRVRPRGMLPQLRVEPALQPLDAVGTTSSALYTSADGSVAVGTAEVGGQTVLVRWLADGSAEVFAPAAGDSIGELNAINAAGTAAAGQLAVAGNPAPFVWTVADGFVVIPELGRELDYDFSRATDVSDDGNTVVGEYGATVVFEGDPPPLGFVWTRAGGAFVLNDLLVAGGFGDLRIFDVFALSADGTRLAATGNLPQHLTDTDTVVITLTP